MCYTGSLRHSSPYLYGTFRVEHQDRSAQVGTGRTGWQTSIRRVNAFHLSTGPITAHQMQSLVREFAITDRGETTYSGTGEIGRREKKAKAGTPGPMLERTHCCLYHTSRYVIIRLTHLEGLDGSYLLSQLNVRRPLLFRHTTLLALRSSAPPALSYGWRPSSPPSGGDFLLSLLGRCLARATIVENDHKTYTFRVVYVWGTETGRPPRRCDRGFRANQ